MSIPAPQPNSYRILVIDDTIQIHEDIRKVLIGPTTTQLGTVEEEILATKPRPAVATASFEIDSAFQGDEGVNKIKQAVTQGRPYALAFIDMRMPPGMDGLETIKEVWDFDPDLQVVICTAYSDYSWEQIAATTGPTTRVMYLRKPFDPIEVRQLAHALTEKWRMEQSTRSRTGQLEHIVATQSEEITESRAVFHVILDDTIRKSHECERHPDGFME